VTFFYTTVVLLLESMEFQYQVNENHLTQHFLKFNLIKIKITTSYIRGSQPAGADMFYMACVNFLVLLYLPYDEK
jgi:hypothetical protein